MQHIDLPDKGKTNWFMVIAIALFAIGLVAIGLIFYPLLLYIAGALLFTANLFLMARRRKRVKRHQEKEWISSDEIF